MNVEAKDKRVQRQKDVKVLQLISQGRLTSFSHRQSMLEGAVQQEAQDALEGHVLRSRKVERRLYCVQAVICGRLATMSTLSFRKSFLLSLILVYFSFLKTNF